MNVIKNKLDYFRKTVVNLQEVTVQFPENKLEKAGVIKHFELAYEQAWVCLKAVIAQEGLETSGPRNVFQKAWQLGYLKQEEVWLDMIQDRNTTVHTYDDIFASEMVDRIMENYRLVFTDLLRFLEDKFG